MAFSYVVSLIATRWHDHGQIKLLTTFTNVFLFILFLMPFSIEVVCVTIFVICYNI